MNTNTKGTIGLLKIADDLVAKGYEVFLPLGDHSRIDCIAFKDGKTTRIQIKYRNVYRNNVEVPMNTMVNGKRNFYNLDHIDLFAVYCPEWGIAYVPPKEGGYFLTEQRFKEATL